MRIKNLCGFLNNLPKPNNLEKINKIYTILLNINKICSNIEIESCENGFKIKLPENDSETDRFVRQASSIAKLIINGNFDKALNMIITCQECYGKFIFKNTVSLQGRNLVAICPNCKNEILSMKGVE